MGLALAISITTGIFCGIWGWLSSLFGLGFATWLGFAGCTSYFASGKRGFGGVKTAFFANLTGSIWAIIAIIVSSKFPNVPTMGFFMTGFISFAMVYQGKFPLVSYVPATFMGCFSTFGVASTGFAVLSSWPMVIGILFLGNLLGITCDLGGVFLHKKLTKKENWEA